MTDPTTTRDEAVLSVDALAQEIRRVDGSHSLGAGALAEALMPFILASAPAPASGGVDAVARRAKYLLNRLETDDGLGIGEIDTMLRMAASLSPAATPVSEAGGAALALDSEMRNAEFETWARKNGCHLHLHEGGEDRRYGYDLTERAWLGWCAALAKPATSPAPVRPIGNQGISDYQREIARNMAEGFAAWNAARQEALPSDEPASSPAGGGVHEAAIGLLSELDAYCVGSRAHDRRVNEARRALKAALSQSTSAGRVGE